ncbi:sulfurtransferase TusA family protein [Cellulomonas alba]|uniref:Sulfurtransferase TusA family protein n=1 Tax=Cellulomonas alba TaxID=3053467 RepID=A0ABT7SBP5_9CELL|nr:sulfurtransferase TusA family protein [Cellulomonas alba]MDM7853616.1 sulfurtransferase TusA family protein [Cellulomonas alba]
MSGPVVVDARGLRCPAPVIRLARAAADAPAGAELTVLATDPAAVHDVPAWARMRGHQMVSATEDGGVHALTVRLGGGSAS